MTSIMRAVGGLQSPSFTQACEIAWSGTITFEHVETLRTEEPVDPPTSACLVPRVTGLAERAAKSRLTAAGCRAKVKRARHRRVKKGRVIMLAQPLNGRTPRAAVLRRAGPVRLIRAPVSPLRRCCAAR